MSTISEPSDLFGKIIFHLRYKPFFLKEAQYEKETQSVSRSCFVNARISGKNIIIILLVITVLSIELLIPEKLEAPTLYEPEIQENIDKSLVTIQKNTLLSMANPLVIQKPQAKIVLTPRPKVINRIKMTITAYSSTVCQTDSTPFITASNTWVRKGIVANNFFPFGTRIRIPEYFGDKIFVIEDRMHWRKSNEHIDIWFPTKQEAINFGITKAYVEILGD